MAKKMPEIGDYKYGFADKDVSIFRSKRGLNKRNRRRDFTDER